MNTHSNEQEEYLASHGHRESELMGTDTTAVREWTWELKIEPSVSPHRCWQIE